MSWFLCPSKIIDTHTPLNGRGRIRRCGNGLKNTHKEFRASFVSRNTSLTNTEGFWATTLADTIVRVMVKH